MFKLRASGKGRLELFGSSSLGQKRVRSFRAGATLPNPELQASPPSSADLTHIRI